MSIASELNALNGYILGAYNEINTMGGTVPANQNMANLASAIGSIPSGSSITVEQLNVSANGTYTAPAGKAYSPIVVNVAGGAVDVVSGVINYDAETSVTAWPQSYLEHNLGKTPKGIAWFSITSRATGNVTGIKNSVLAYYADETATYKLHPYGSNAAALLYWECSSSHTITNQFIIGIPSSEGMNLTNDFITSYNKVPAGSFLKWFVWG